MAEYFDRSKMEKPEFEERVVSVDRVSYTVAGGRRLRFRALVVVGNRQGKVGMGVSKAGEVATAIQKAVAAAKKRLITVAITNETIPHGIQVSYGGATVLLKPAPAGTSVIAGGSVRAVIELAGIKNIRSKALGSNNKINNVAATLEALRRVRPGQGPANVKIKELPAAIAEDSALEEPVAVDEEIVDADSEPSDETPTKKSSKAKVTKKVSTK